MHRSVKNVMQTFDFYLVKDWNLLVNTTHVTFVSLSCHTHKLARHIS